MTDSPNIDDWLERVRPSMLIWASAFTRDRDRAEDAVQQASIEFAVKYRSGKLPLDPAESLALLRTIVTRRAIDVSKEKARYHQILEQYSNKEPPENPDNTPQLESAIDLSEAIERLSTSEKQLIKKRYYEFRTLAEIGEELGCLAPTIMRRLNKILSKLNDLLSD